MAFKFNPLTGKLDTVDDPGGVDTNVQFNDSGTFGGVTDFTYNKTSKVLTNKGDLNLDDGSAFTTTLQTVTPTTNRTVTFPDASGIVGLVGGSSGQIQFNNSGVQGGLSTLLADGSGNLTLSGRMTNTFNSLASAPAKSWTGTWFTGGTATTTKPHLLLEPTGTTSTNWSTAGTGLGINAAAAFTGNLADFQINGSRLASLSSTGSFRVLGGLGYLTGAGGTVTQTVSRTSSVSINKLCGNITLFAASGSSTWLSFSVNNTTVTTGDTVIVCQASGSNKYGIFVTNVANNIFEITFSSVVGTVSESPVFNFTVVKSVTS